MENSSQDKETSSTCQKCGGTLEKRRRPLSLGDLLAIVTLVALGAVPVVATRHSDMILMAGFFYGLGVFTLLGGVVIAPRYRRRPRCVECWAPPHPPRRPQAEMDFWVVYVAVVGLYLSMYVILYMET